MKLAVILFGHYRTFDTNIDYWRGINGDFYISTWDTLDSTTKTWHKQEVAGTPLTTEQIETLKSFDANCYIGTQEWIESELSDIYGKMPFKSILYKYESIMKSVHRILESKIEYDTVIITRPDIRINTNDLPSPARKEIFVSFRQDRNFLHGLSGSDLICVIHYSDLRKFAIIPQTLLDWKVNCKKYRYAEEHFTDYIYQEWETVNKTYEYDKTFGITRVIP